MANVEINDLSSKATPVVTDELEIQETAGGDSKKVTLQDILDDVIGKTGTFSPMLTDAGLDEVDGQTASLQDGRYQLIGDWCHFTVQLTMTSIGTLTPSFNAYMLNLPFDAAGQDEQVVSVYTTGGTHDATQTGEFGTILDGESYVVLKYDRAGADAGIMDIATIGGTGKLYVSGKYRTA